MSYRIHLHIVSKKRFEKLYDPKNPYDSLRVVLKNSKSHELWDELNLDMFEKLDGEYSEYHPRKLDKSEFRNELLKFYQKTLLDYEMERSKKDAVIQRDRDSHRSNYIEFYFERLLEDDKILTYTGHFLLDYFNLVFKYNNFREAKHIGIITHG